jgi:hypothetical protein
VTLFVGIDWGKDGTYSGLDDVTLRAAGGKAGIVSCQYGRDGSTATAPATAGRGSMVLKNEDRALSPRNTSSPLYGQLKPGRPVLIQRTIGATTFTLFRGHTDYAPLNPDISSRKVSISLVDALQDFRKQQISTGLYGGIRTGDAIGVVLDAAGWTGGRDLDAGSTLIPWWWLAGTDALTALQELVASEGPPALLTVGSSGEIVFRGRHHRLTRSRSVTSQSTWRGSVVEPVMQGFTYDESWANIVNSVTATVDVREPAAGDPTVVWTSSGTVDIADGETKLVTVATSDPFTAAVVPDSSDLVFTGAIAVDLTRTSGSVTTIRLTASGGPARVTGMRLRAVSVPVARQVQISASDTTSISDYGPRGYTTAMPWAGPLDAQAIINTVVAQRGQPLPILTIRFQVGGSNTSRAAALLALNLSDRVTVIEADTGLSADFTIESIGHDLTGEEDHALTFGLEAVPTQPALVFILGSATRGVLGTNRLGREGLDDPSTVFVLGTGVLGTNLLAH